MSASKKLWYDLKLHLSHVMIPTLTLQSALLGFLQKMPHYELINHLLLIFKIYVYNSRQTKKVSIRGLFSAIKKICDLEIKTQEFNRSDLYYEDKWTCIIGSLSIDP